MTYSGANQAKQARESLGKALEAKNLGADATVVEEVAAAQAMERVVIERFGVKLNVGRPDGGSGSHGPPPRRVP